MLNVSLYRNTTHEEMWGNVSIVPHILKHHTGGRWSLSSRFGREAPRESPPFLSDRRLGGSQNWSIHGGKQENKVLCPCQNSNSFRPRHFHILWQGRHPSSCLNIVNFNLQNIGNYYETYLPLLNRLFRSFDIGSSFQVIESNKQ